MKQIIWIQDQDEKTHPGGAQQTNRFMINYGKNLGFQIKEYTLKDITSEEIVREILEQKGLFILNNIVKIYREHPNIINWIVYNRPFVRYEHDYLWIHNILPENLVRDIFIRCIASIFLSPLHYEEHVKRLKIVRNPSSIPSPIDIRKFKILTEPGIARNPNSVIYAGGIGWHKGIEGIINHAKKNQKLSYHLFGWVEQADLIRELPENIEVFPKLPFDNIEEVYNRYEYAIHLPNWREPFGRFIPEAFLCGCEPITNNNLGFKSWNIEGKSREELAQWLEESPRIFWQTVYDSYLRGVSNGG